MIECACHTLPSLCSKVMLTLVLPLTSHFHEWLSNPYCSHQAAEMDEADDFVETMAWLSYLEECDERSRNFEGLKKRWSARRADGLIGKPNPRKEVLETRARSGTLTHVSDTDLVPYLSRKFKEKPRGRMLVSQQYGHVPRNMKSNRRFGVQGPIQQPKCLKNRR